MFFKGNFSKFTWIFFFFGIFISSLHSQQDIFNVPNMTITPKNKFFLQQQNIFYPGLLQSDTTLIYGIGNKREIGMNAYNFFWNYSPESKYSESISKLYKEEKFFVSPNITLNYQERFDINEWFALSLGGKYGIEKIKRPVGNPGLGYLMVRLSILKEKIIILGGVFTGNSSYLGKFKTAQFSNNQSSEAVQDYLSGGYNYLIFNGVAISRLNKTDKNGALGGIEIEIIPKKLFFIADAYSGVHSLGISVWGFCYYFNDSIFINLGWQVPNPRGSLANPHSLLFEFNAYF